jgi:hypothetical protein
LTALQDEVAIRNSVGKKEALITNRIIRRWQLMLLDRLMSFWRNYTQDRKSRDLKLQICFEAKRKRIVLNRVFGAWVKYSFREKAVQMSAEFLQAQAKRAEGDEKVLADFQKMADSLEAVTQEKNRLQEQYKRISDDLVQTQSTLEKLQVRYDHQKNMLNSWRECALQLTAVLRFPVKSAAVSSQITKPEAHGLPSPTKTPPSLLEEQSSPVGAPSSPHSSPRGPANLMGLIGFTPAPSATVEVLNWVNKVRRSLDRSEDTDQVPFVEIDNFGTDISDGVVLEDLVEFLDIGVKQPTQKERKTSSDPSDLSAMSSNLAALQRFASCQSMVLSAEDIASCKKPDTVRLLLTLVMRRASLCPVCSPEGIASLNGVRVNQLLDFRSPFEVNEMFSKCVSTYRAVAQAHSNACGAAAVDSLATSNSMISASLDRDLVTKLFALRGQTPPSRADLDELTVEVARRSAELYFIFRCYAPLSFGGSVSQERFHKLTADTKLLDKSLSPGDVSVIFDYLCRMESSKPRNTAPHLVRPDQVLQTGLGITAVTAFLVFLSSKSHETAASAAFRFGSLVDKTRKVAVPSGIDDFREVYTSAVVQEFLAKNSASLLKMYEDATALDASGDGLSLTQLATLLKENKISLATEDILKLAKFVSDDYSSEGSPSLSFDMFLQCIVATGLSKYPSLWITPLERLKIFFKRDVVVSAVQPQRLSGSRKKL